MENATKKLFASFAFNCFFFQVGQISQIFDAMDFLGLYPNDIPSGKVLYKLQGAFKQLQHFNTSFFGIVLPEGLKSFQSEDPSGKDSLHVFVFHQCLLNSYFFGFFAVDSLAMELTEIVNEAGLSLEELIQELQVEVRYAGTGSLKDMTQLPHVLATTSFLARSIWPAFFQRGGGERGSERAGQLPEAGSSPHR